MSDLYADLVVQDKKERDLKQVRVDNSDPDGLKEAAVRQSFVGMSQKYTGLLKSLTKLLNWLYFDYTQSSMN